MSIATMASSGQTQYFNIMAVISSLDNLYLAGKPLCWLSMLVNFGGHPARNMQKQCMLGYGWEFQSKMAVHVQSVCSPLVESDGTSLQHVNDYSGVCI